MGVQIRQVRIRPHMWVHQTCEVIGTLGLPASNSQVVRHLEDFLQRLKILRGYLLDSETEWNRYHHLFSLVQVFCYLVKVNVPIYEHHKFKVIDWLFL